MAAYTLHDYITALFIAALSTGVYLCTIGYCLRWLMFNDEGWKPRKRINWTMLIATLTLATLSSTHLVLATTTTVRAIQLAIDHATAGPLLPWSATIMCTVTNLSVLITDGFLIYRCWLVCLKSLTAIVFPCIFWVGGLVCTILQIYWQVVMSADISGVWVPVFMTIGPGTILTPFWASTIVVNLYATGRIVYGIWKASNAQRRMDSTAGDLNVVLRVMLDSGMLYLIVTIPHFVVWWTECASGILILGWMNLPIVCSAFNLILIRTSHYRAVSDDKQDFTDPISEMRFECNSKVENQNIPGSELSGTTVSVGAASIV